MFDITFLDNVICSHTQTEYIPKSNKEKTMKKQFNIWLNIATICLSICAIVIGVYALQNATLNVTGSIGFKAQGLKATVEVKMYGHSETSDGTPVASTSPTTVKEETTVTDEMTISLNTIYFTNKSSSEGKAEDVVIEFTYKNKSAFEVLAKVTTEESSICDNSSVTAEVEYAYMSKGSESSPATGAMKIILKLDAETESFSENANVSIDISLEKTSTKKYVSGANQDKPIVVNKYTEEEQTAICETIHSSSDDTTKKFCYAVNYPYYITMGKAGELDIRWLVVGYNNKGALTLLTDDDKKVLQTGVLLSDKIYILLSAEVIGEDRKYTDISNCELVDEDTGLWVNKKEQFASLGVNANDYYASDIREYLINTGETGFESIYSLSTEDTGITIQPRDLSELYADMDDVSVGQISTNQTGGDKIWLINTNENITLFGSFGRVMRGRISATTRLGKSDDIKNIYWWFRDSGSDSKTSYAIGFQGDYVAPIDVLNVALAVRPACQI